MRSLHLAALITANLAPWIGSVRRWPSPRLVTPPLTTQLRQTSLKAIVQKTIFKAREVSLVPFQPQRIDHLVLRVADLEASVAFYGSVMGCTVERRRDELGLVHLRTGSSMIDLVSIDGKLGRNGGRAPAQEGRNLDHLCVRVEPFDESAIRAHLAKLGVDIEGELAQNFGAEGTGPALYIRDPDGNLIELKGPATAPNGDA